jgi:hypothetical protein
MSIELIEVKNGKLMHRGIAVEGLGFSTNYS